MNPATIDKVFAYVQERCLWQFFSRAWDRTEVIDGVLGKTAQLLTGEPVKVESPTEKAHYADARLLAEGIRARFSDISALPAEDVKALIEGVRGRVTELAITQSRNRELHQKLY